MVLVLDDDVSILTSLERLLSSHGYGVRVYNEPSQLFKDGEPDQPACLLLDEQLGNGVRGVDVHAEIKRLGWLTPIIFITAHWNVKLIVETMRAGADGFVPKPYTPSDLLDSVRLALAHSEESRRAVARNGDVVSRVASLTAREREVVCLVASGLLNKEIADKLGIALVTVKVHRGRAMRKLCAGNPAELTRIAASAGLIA